MSSIDINKEIETLNIDNTLLDPNRVYVQSSRLSTSMISPRVSATKSTSDDSVAQLAERMEFGLAWIGLTYSPHKFMSDTHKTILRDISGQIKFGEIVGLMGPSGCGKSTLLRCINGRIGNGLSDETDMYVSSRRTIQSCFIVQDVKEHLLMLLTVRESLSYASKIKNQSFNDNESLISDKPSNDGRLFASTFGLMGGHDSFDHSLNIEKLLSDLTLSDCADTLIGDCSGGQQKRIVIALELVGEEKPNIMCIDEPTSGLDSNAAEQVIDCLRNVCRDHSIGIITTIHQPNSDILMMFDSLYVLSKGGYNVYNGKPDGIREFLQRLNVPMTDIQVPIEVLIKLASKTIFNDKHSEEFEVSEEIKAMTKRAKNSSEELRSKCQAFGRKCDVKSINIESIGFNLNDFWHLMMRTGKSNIIRGWKPFLFITLFEVITGVSTGILFGRVGGDDGCLPYNPNVPQNITCIPIENHSVKEAQYFQNFKFLFYSVLMHNFLQLCFTILTFPMEVKIFFNEQHNRWYSSGSYYWAKNLIDGFLGILVTIVFTIAIYLVTGQIGTIFGKRFSYYLLSMSLSTLCAQGMSYAFSIIATKNLRTTLILGIGGNLINTLFSGFLLPVAEMNPVMRFIANISYVKATFESQIYAIYGFDRCPAALNRYSAILYRMDLREDSFHFNLTLLVVQTVFWRVFALICLIVKTNDVGISFMFNNHRFGGNKKTQISAISNNSLV